MNYESWLFKLQLTVGNIKSAELNELNYQFKTNINMKTKTSILDKSKAYFILLVSGWRSVEIFGTPKDTMGTYIVCLKNNAVMEFNYSNFDGDIRWWKMGMGVGDEHDDNPIVFWKPMPKSPYACH